MKFAQSSAVYFNYSLQYAIKDLKHIGYTGIEIWGGRPHMYRDDLQDQLPEIKALLEEHEIKVCNVIPAQFRYPSMLCSLNERVRRDSVSYIATAMDNAQFLGAPSISLCAGMLPWDMNIRAGWGQLRRSFEEIHRLNHQRGLALLIEPAHRFESNLILTVADALKMINELQVDDFGVLVDTGHCHLNGESFPDVVASCADVPFHIHIDDNLGDWDSHLIPGSGTIDFGPLAKALLDQHYDGFISAEIGGKYIMNPAAACAQTLQELKRLFSCSDM